MLGVLGFLVRLVIRLKVIVISVTVGAAIAFALQARQESRTWGIDAVDRTRRLPGDDLVTAPDHVETRSLVIEALPATVWALIVKMGYGRAGWYSYPILDRAWRPMGPSSWSGTATRGGAASSGGAAPSGGATPETLAEGDVVPTDPDGGLVARVVEPEHALVLYLDDAALRDRFEQRAAEGSEQARDMLDQLDEMPAFAVSWAFVLEPEPGGRTRLVERMRLQMNVSAGQKRALPIMGLTLFAFIRRQMLGIKRRAEAGAG
jgi:hypothetical protein